MDLKVQNQPPGKEISHFFPFFFSCDHVLIFCFLGKGGGVMGYIEHPISWKKHMLITIVNFVTILFFWLVEYLLSER